MSSAMKYDSRDEIESIMRWWKIKCFGQTLNKKKFITHVKEHKGLVFVYQSEKFCSAKIIVWASNRFSNFLKNDSSVENHLLTTAKSSTQTWIEKTNGKRRMWIGQPFETSRMSIRNYKIFVALARPFYILIRIPIYDLGVKQKVVNHSRLAILKS